MDFPGHKHATLYNIYKIEPAVKKLLLSRGIKLLMADPAVKTEYEGDTITAVITKSGLRLTADAFVDVSGSSAMPLNCNKHGNGCAMCILRCHSLRPPRQRHHTVRRGRMDSRKAYRSRRHERLL